MQKSIVYKGKKYGLLHVTNNIIREYNKADTIFKNDWYNEAHEYCKKLSMFANMAKINLEFEQVIGVTAALSPLKSWSQNKKLASNFILNANYSGTMSTFKNKALAIMALKPNELGEIPNILRGDKITAFYHNILNPQNTDHITIDRHAVNIALNGFKYEGAANYDFFKQAYINAANKLNISPIMLQSITWQSWRNRNQYKKRK